MVPIWTKSALQKIPIPEHLVSGNILFTRYLKSRKWLDDIREGKYLKRYSQTIGLIEEYSAEYRFDPLMIAAQGYQESKLDQNKRSPKGARVVLPLDSGP